jgi:signal transduction histidine kinase
MAADEPSRASGSPRRGHGIRVRTTAAAVLVVGVGLVVAAVSMVGFLERSLRDDVRSAALNRAETIATDLAADAVPPVLDVGDEEEEFAQVLDSGGSIVAASGNLAGLGVMAALEPGQDGIVEHVPFESGPFLVVARSAPTPDGPVTVVVGRTLEDVGEATGAVIASLAVGIPLLVLLVGAVTWRVVGRALAPVEAIRAEVEAISSEELHRRVPDPRGADEIARLAATMNRMLARLEDGQLRQRRFVSDASHELRSPVASIRQRAEVALEHPEKVDLRELAEVVLEEDARLQRIVEDLLLLTRIDEGTARAGTEPVDLDDLVFQEAARLRGATALTVDTSGVSAARVRGDRTQLERLLRNLTDNAARHARRTIAMSLRDRDAAAVLTVDDDGPGIAPGDRDRVFDRFVRLDEARDRDSGGSGLGLSIVREVAALHGGSVTASDAPLGGARFEVRLRSVRD